MPKDVRAYPPSSSSQAIIRSDLESLDNLKHLSLKCLIKGYFKAESDRPILAVQRENTKEIHIRCELNSRLNGRNRA